MMKIRLAVLVLLAGTGVAMAAGQPMLRVNVQGVEGHGAPLPSEYALCVPDKKTRSRTGANVNPFVSWTGAPEETKSYAVVMHDSSVSVDLAAANKKGKMIAADVPRQNLYHWVLVDIPTQLKQINYGQETYKQGQFADKAAYGMRGRNDLGNRGYDGACPPWNDEATHQYHFTVYALDVESLGLSGDFTATEALAKMPPHILARGEAVADFSQNLRLKY